MKYNNKLYTIYNLLILANIIERLHGFCLGSPTPICLEEVPEEEAMEKLTYVLGKYEEVEQKIIGEPVSVSGKRIATETSEDVHIDFRYKDNTDIDIIQVCSFVIRNAVNECETISTTCNSYISRTPRPILMRKTLSVCDGNVEVQAEVVEPTEIDPDVEIVTSNETASQQDSTSTRSRYDSSEIL